MTNTTRRTRKATSAPVTTDAPTPAESAIAPAPVATDAPTDTTPAPKSGKSDAAYTIPDIGTDQSIDDYVSSVGAAYRDADKSTKATMRTAWARFQSDAIQAMDMGQIAIVRGVNAVLVTTKAPVEVDPADAYVIHLAALSQAMYLANEAFREAHGDEAFQAMTERVANLTDDEVTARDALATKLAVVKSTNRRTGPQRSVEAHIRSALDAAPAGTILTCAQIHNHRSDAYGPDESPSVGAIGAAHGREMDGIVSDTNSAGTKGFRLA